MLTPSYRPSSLLTEVHETNRGILVDAQGNLSVSQVKVCHAILGGEAALTVELDAGAKTTAEIGMMNEPEVTDDEEPEEPSLAAENSKAEAAGNDPELGSRTD